MLSIQLQRIYIILVVLIFHTGLSGQELNTGPHQNAIGGDIQRLVMKRITYANAMRNLNYIEDERTDSVSNVASASHVLRTISYPGFGLSECNPKFFVRRIDSLKFSTYFDLYETVLDTSACDFYRFNAKINTNIGRSSGNLYNHYNSLRHRKRFLLAINKTNRSVLYLSGFDQVDDFSNYVLLNTKDVSTFEHFLKLRLYSANFSEIKFLDKLDNGRLLFRGSKHVGGTLITEIITINEDNPHTNIERETEPYQIKYVDEVPEWRRNLIRVMPFESFREKRHFILDALMRNMVSYSLKKARTEILSEQNDSQSMDELIAGFPDYNKLYNYFNIRKVNFRNSTNKGWNRKYIIEYGYNQLILEEDYIVGYKRKNPAIEFYQVFKAYNAELVSRANPMLNECRSDSLVSSTVFDSYLIALDVTSKELYFISGRNIFLSDVLPLYASFSSVTWGSKKTDWPQFQSWERRLQLNYIQDRLYSEKIVLPLTAEHVVVESDDGLQLNVPVVDNGQVTYIKVVLDYHDPNLLRISKS